MPVTFPRLLGALAMAALLPSIAIGQQEKGDKEIQIFGNISTQSQEDGPSLTNGSLGGFLGYFFTRQLQLKGGLIMNLSGGGPDGGTLATAIVTGGVVYNLTTQGRKTFPYVGIDLMSIGTNTPDSKPLNAYRPAAGFKTFFTRNAAFDLNVGMQKFTGEQSADMPTTVDSRFGLSFVF